MNEEAHDRLAETWKKQGISTDTVRACLTTPPACPVCHGKGRRRVLGFDSRTNAYACGDGHEFPL
jgi:hypothetical protein